MSTHSSVHSSMVGAEPRRSPYRPDIDGLRAVAVIAVVIYHLDPTWLPSGLVGVDIFFIISGFVVTSSLRDRVEKAGSFYEFAIDFFARRAKRLLPLSLLVISCAALALALVAPHWDPRAERFLLVGLSGTFANANNWLVYERDDYMDLLSKDVHAYNPFLHLWSLGVEEQFYIVAPILLYGSLKLLAEGRQPDTWTFLLLSAASIVFCWWADEVQRIPSYAFYLLFSRFWELSVGVLLCLFCSGRETVIADLLQHQPLVVLLLQGWTLLLLGVAFCVKFDEDSFPLPGAIMPVAGTVGYILSGWAPSAILNAVLKLPPLVYVGKISYSIYLWHVPVAAICRWLTLGSDLAVEAKLCCVLSTTVLAVLSYHLLEAPTRKLESSSKTSLCYSFLAMILTAIFVTSLLVIRHVVLTSNCYIWLTLAALLFLLALFGAHLVHSVASVQLLYVFCLFSVIFGITYNIYHDNVHLQHKTQIRVNPEVNISTPRPLLSPESSCSLCSCANDVSTYHAPPETCLPNQCACARSELPSCFTGTPLSDADFHPAVPWGHENCLGVQLTEEEILSRCLTPQSQRTHGRAIWLIGDSHSFALVPCITPSANAAGLNVYNYSWPAHHACDFEWSKVLNALDEVVNPDDIVAFSACFYCMQWCLPHYEELIIRLKAFTQVRNARLLVFKDVPLLNDDSLNCANSDPWKQSQCSISAPQALADVEDTKKMLSAYASSYDMIDLFSPMCANGICDIWVPGTSAVAYVDSHHINMNGCLYLAPFICAEMRKLGFYP